jgi:peptide/nickel transport system substrate-binding protein
LGQGRIPKLAKLVVIPMPEATTRLSALRAGQVDWIEVPPPDAIPSLKAAGFQISLWPYPHTWPYLFNTSDGSVFHDRRVRQAMNFAIDRDALVKFLNGTAKPAVGLYPPDNAYFGNPTLHYSYDPERAKALLKEAGYGPDHPVKAKIMISTSGSGQMLPLPMNEILQQQLQAVGFELDFDVVEWGTMLIAKRSAPEAPASHNDDALNNSLGFSDPSVMPAISAKPAFRRTASTGVISRRPGRRIVDQGAGDVRHAERDRLVAQAHAIVVDEAPWLFIVHDLNPRALSPHVKGFQPAQSWYQDFTQLTVE